MRHPACRRTMGSGRLEVYGRNLAVAAGFEVVGDALVLVQRVHARGLDRSDVDEAVARAVFIFDEAITLVAVEEFYGADGHGMCPFTKTGNPPASAPAELVACEGKIVPREGP